MYMVRAGAKVTADMQYVLHEEAYSPPAGSDVIVERELLEYFARRQMAWVMCVAIPYHASSCAAIILQRRRPPGFAGSMWTLEDLQQLEEISTQGKLFEYLCIRCCLTTCTPHS